MPTIRRHKIASSRAHYRLVERSFEREFMPYCLKNRFTLLAFSALGSGIQSIRPNDPSGVLVRVAAATVKTEPQVAQLEYYKRGSDRPREVQLAMRVVKDSEATFWRFPPEHLARRMRESGFATAAQWDSCFARPPGEFMTGAAASD
jgi:hypothetical protein